MSQYVVQESKINDINYVDALSNFYKIWGI